MDSQALQQALSDLQRIQARTANLRTDFVHPLTAALVSQHEGICIEDLNNQALAKTKLGKSILDAAFGELRRQLAYKTIWNRRHLAVVDRWFPSSRTRSQVRRGERRAPVGRSKLDLYCMRHPS